MTQPLTDKIEALKTLLPQMTVYLALMAGGKVTRRYGQADENEKNPGPPPPVWTFLDCSGECARCPYDPQTATGRDRCRGEAWERTKAYYERAYRMDEVERAYRLMEDARPWLVRPVWAVYVEPCESASEPISVQAKAMRQRVADDGVGWMAGQVRCDLVAYGEQPSLRANQIRQMIAQGFTWKRIAKDLRCSRRDISAALAVHESAVGV